MVGGKKRTRKSVKMENDVLRSAHSCVALCIMFLYSQRLVGFRMVFFLTCISWALKHCWENEWNVCRYSVYSIDLFWMQSFKTKGDF